MFSFSFFLCQDCVSFILIWSFVHFLICNNRMTQIHLELIRRLENFLFYNYDWWNNYYKIWFVFFEHLKLPQIYIYIYIYKVAWLTFNSFHVFLIMTVKCICISHIYLYLFIFVSQWKCNNLYITLYTWLIVS